MSRIWREKVEERHFVKYKVTSNKHVLSFSEEVDDYLSEHKNHLYCVELSNSTLRFVLTVKINPLAHYKKDGKLFTKILDKECAVNYIEDIDLGEKGIYIKTLKMDRDESIARAVDILKKHNMPLFVYLDDTITRYKDTDLGRSYEKFLEDL